MKMVHKHHFMKRSLRAGFCLLHCLLITFSLRLKNRLGFEERKFALMQMETHTLNTLELGKHTNTTETMAVCLLLMCSLAGVYSQRVIQLWAE